MDHDDGAVIGCLDATFDIGGIDDAAPRYIDGVDGGAQGPCDLGVAFAELAVDANQHAFAGGEDVDEARLHHSCSGAGEEEHGISCAQHELEHFFGAVQEGDELGSTMAQNRSSHGLAHTLGDRRGSRQTQPVSVSNHRCLMATENCRAGGRREPGHRLLRFLT